MAGRTQAVFMGEIIVCFLTSPRAKAFNSLTGTQEYRMVGALDTNYTEFKLLNKKTLFAFTYFTLPLCPFKFPTFSNVVEEYSWITLP